MISLSDELSINKPSGPTLKWSLWKGDELSGERTTFENTGCQKKITVFGVLYKDVFNLFPKLPCLTDFGNDNKSQIFVICILCLF